MDPRFLVLVVMVGTASCSSGSGSGSGAGAGDAGSTPVPGVVTTTESTYCEQATTRVTKCGADGGAPSSTSCAKEHRCVAATHALPDVYLSCRTSSDCSASVTESACEKKASEASGAPGSADRDACYAKRSECQKVGKTFSDDRSCYVLRTANVASAKKINDCISQPCDQIAACVAALEADFADCY